jgi:hypothetical protein
MNITEILSDLETRASAADLAMTDACKRAGFHPSTFYRWKGGSPPSTRLLIRLEQVICEAESVEGAA